MVLLNFCPSRGAITAAPSPEDVKHILKFLGRIEGLDGELACKRATDEEIDEIRALHYEMLAAFAHKDHLAYFRLNQCIHRSLVMASGNLLLIETHKGMNTGLHRIRYR